MACRLPNLCTSLTPLRACRLRSPARMALDAALNATLAAAIDAAASFRLELHFSGKRDLRRQRQRNLEIITKISSSTAENRLLIQLGLAHILASKVSAAQNSAIHDLLSHRPPHPHGVSCSTIARQHLTLTPSPIVYAYTL